MFYRLVASLHLVQPEYPKNQTPHAASSQKFDPSFPRFDYLQFSSRDQS